MGKNNYTGCFVIMLIFLFLLTKWLGTIFS